MKFDPHHPKTPEPMATKIGRGDYFPDIYPFAKLRYDLIRGFCPCICEVAYQMFTRLVFWGSSNFLPCADFDDQCVKRRRFAQECAFWESRKLNFYILTPFSPKSIFSVDFRRDRKFRLKTWYNMGTSSIDTPLKRPATILEVGWWIGKPETHICTSWVVCSYLWENSIWLTAAILKMDMMSQLCRGWSDLDEIW